MSNVTILSSYLAVSHVIIWLSHSICDASRKSWGIAKAGMLSILLLISVNQTLKLFTSWAKGSFWRWLHLQTHWEGDAAIINPNHAATAQHFSGFNLFTRNSGRAVNSLDLAESPLVLVSSSSLASTQTLPKPRCTGSFSMSPPGGTHLKHLCREEPTQPNSLLSL